MVEGGGVRRVIPHTPPCSTCWRVSPRTHSQICTCHALRCIALAVTCYHSTTHRRSMASTDVQSMRGGEGQGGKCCACRGRGPASRGGDRWRPVVEGGKDGGGEGRVRECPARRRLICQYPHMHITIYPRHTILFQRLSVCLPVSADKLLFLSGGPVRQTAI